jgi:hypothetical protein
MCSCCTGRMESDAGGQCHTMKLKEEPMEGQVGVAAAVKSAGMARRVPKKGSSKRDNRTKAKPGKNMGEESGGEEEQGKENAGMEALARPGKRRKTSRHRSGEAGVGVEPAQGGSEEETQPTASGEGSDADKGGGHPARSTRGRGSGGGATAEDTTHHKRSKKGGRGVGDMDPGGVGGGMGGTGGGRRGRQRAEAEAEEGEVEEGGRRRQRRTFATYRDPRVLLQRMIQHKLLPQVCLRFVNVFFSWLAGLFYP